MIYLIDANVLIRANQDYYALERVPQFWQWLEHETQAGRIKMPFEIHNEIAVSRGVLRDWICAQDVRAALILDEEVDAELLDMVLTQGYGEDLSEVDVEKIGNDAFLIAYALAEPDRVVVTKETSKPSAQRSNRKIPDVCETLGLPCIDDFELYRSLNFSTAER